jgi:hypothetical protein
MGVVRSFQFVVCISEKGKRQTKEECRVKRRVHHAGSKMAAEIGEK